MLCWRPVFRGVKASRQGLFRPYYYTGFSAGGRTVKGSNSCLLVSQAVKSSKPLLALLLYWFQCRRAPSQGAKQLSPGQSTSQTVKASFGLIIMILVKRENQSKARTAVSWSLILLVLVYGAVSQGVKPRSPRQSRVKPSRPFVALIYWF